MINVTTIRDFIGSRFNEPHRERRLRLAKGETLFMVSPGKQVRQFVIAIAVTDDGPGMVPPVNQTILLSLERVALLRDELTNLLEQFSGTTLPD